MIGFDYLAPDSLEEACSLLGERGEDARLIAGGTALVLLMKQRLVRPEVLVSLKRLEALRNVEHVDGQLRIGATATHRSVEQNAHVRQHLPVLAETLRRVATPRIRNQGTLGGNLAHADPNQDPPPTLLVLNAAVELRSAGGERSVPLDEFFTDYYETAIRPGEILTSIRIPLPAAGTSAAFIKFLPRTADDYATVSASASLRLDQGRLREVRVALGSAGPTPLRARQAESMLEGQEPSEALLREAAATVKDEVDPIGDIRGSAGYKRDMAAVFAYRAVRQALDGAETAARA